jgi:hypothetical protein
LVLFHFKTVFIGSQFTHLLSVSVSLSSQRSMEERHKHELHALQGHLFISNFFHWFTIHPFSFFVFFHKTVFIGSQFTHFLSLSFHKGRLDEVTHELQESRDQRHQLSRSHATLAEAKDALGQLLQRTKEESAWALQKVKEVFVCLLCVCVCAIVVWPHFSGHTFIRTHLYPDTSRFRTPSPDTLSRIPHFFSGHLPHVSGHLIRTPCPAHLTFFRPHYFPDIYLRTVTGSRLVRFDVFFSFFRCTI